MTILILILHSLDLLAQPQFEVWSSFGIHESLGSEDILQDSEGYLWVASRNKGLLRFDGSIIYPFSFEIQDTSSINSNYITSLAEYKNKIIAGTKSNGWYILDKDTHNGRRYFSSIHEGQKNTWVEDLLVSENKLFIATYDGLCIQDLITQSLSYFPIKAALGKNPKSCNEVMCIYPSNEDKNLLYIGTTCGLFSFNILSSEYTYYEMPIGILNSQITDSSSVLPIQIRDIIQDDKSKLYMATWGGGLLTYDPSSEKWTRFDLEPGWSKNHRALSHNITHNIFVYSKDTVFVTTNLGIYSFYPSKGIFSPFAQEKSLRASGAGFYSYNFLKLLDGSILISNDRTLLKSKLQTNNKFSKIDINYISSDKGQIFNKRDFIDGLNLEGKPHNISLHISHPDYEKTDTIFYKLENGMSDWQIVNNNIIFLTGLIHNDRLTIKTSYGNQINLNIKIKLRIYQKWWFYPLLTLVIIGTIFGFILLAYQNKLKTTKLAQSYENKLIEMEMQTLKAQMNPHFLFNSLNAIKHYALTKTPYETSDYISRFSLLIRKILNNSTQKIVTLDQELETLRLYIDVESLRFIDKFEHTIHIDPMLNLSEIWVPPLILQPFVENAIWHGLMHLPHKGHLMINIFGETNQIMVTIMDNGVGRESSRKNNEDRLKKDKSYGIDITQSRINLIEKMYGVKAKFWIDDLYDLNGHALGTKVTLIIPKIKE